MEVLDHNSIGVTSNDEKNITKTGNRDIIKERTYTFFQWIHLITIICLTIILIVYIIIDNNKKESMAAANLRKETEIANSLQRIEHDITQANRLYEIMIVEQCRQTDRELALDQQRENILHQYQMFMANLLMENGMALNVTPMAKPVAISMTLTTLSQLDSRRRSILLRSLYHSKLITLQRNSQPSDTSVLQLGLVDLRDIVFGSPRDSIDERPRHLYIDWYYLWLPYATLTNASFRHTWLNCATFSSSYMNSVDLSFVSQADHTCFGVTRAGQIDFSRTSLANASLYKTQFRFTSFNIANLTFANMRELYCVECTFWSATLFQVDLSFSFIFATFLFGPERLDFTSTDFRQATMASARFISINFSQSDWSNTNASQITLRNCSFTNAKMENSTLTKSNIYQSIFQNSNLFNVDLSNATLYNVSFINSDMRNVNMSYIQCNYCAFTNTTMKGATFKNASFISSTFLNCHVDESQLNQTIDLSGSILSNGTIVERNQ